MSRFKTNPDGLTWPEWACAAWLPFSNHELSWHEPKLFRKERKAWLAGEDPMEWARLQTNFRYKRVWLGEDPIPLTPENLKVGAVIVRNYTYDKYEVISFETWMRGINQAFSFTGTRYPGGLSEERCAYEFFQYWSLQPNPQNCRWSG